MARSTNEDILSLCDRITAFCIRLNKRLDAAHPWQQERASFYQPDPSYALPAYATPWQTTAEPYFDYQPPPLYQPDPEPASSYGRQPLINAGIATYEPATAVTNLEWRLPALPQPTYTPQISPQQLLLTATLPHQNYPEVPPPNTYQPPPPPPLILDGDRVEVGVADMDEQQPPTEAYGQQHPPPETLPAAAPPYTAESQEVVSGELYSLPEIGDFPAIEEEEVHVAKDVDEAQNDTEPMVETPTVIDEAPKKSHAPIAMNLKLFIAGFGAHGVFGSVVGSLAEKQGQKRDMCRDIYEVQKVEEFNATGKRKRGHKQRECYPNQENLLHVGDQDLIRVEHMIIGHRSVALEADGRFIPPRNNTQCLGSIWRDPIQFSEDHFVQTCLFLNSSEILFQIRALIQLGIQGGWRMFEIKKVTSRKTIECLLASWLPP